MPAKKWTKHQREAFAKTIAAKRQSRVKRSQPVPDAVYVRVGNKLWKCRPQSFTLYIPINA